MDERGEGREMGCELALALRPDPSLDPDLDFAGQESQTSVHKPQPERSVSLALGLYDHIDLQT